MLGGGGATGFYKALCFRETEETEEAEGNLTPTPRPWSAPTNSQGGEWLALRPKGPAAYSGGLLAERAERRVLSEVKDVSGGALSGLSLTYGDSRFLG